MSKEKKISKNSVVSISYRLEDRAGNLLDGFTKEQAYDYLHGASQILPALEAALEGKKVGDELHLELEAKDAYGPYKDDLITVVEKAHFGNEYSLFVGMRFATKGPSGEDVIVEIVEVDDHTVTLDGNHPLAGVDLVFDVVVLGVRPATQKEIEQAMAKVPKEQIH